MKSNFSLTKHMQVLSFMPRNKPQKQINKPQQLNNNILVKMCFLLRGLTLGKEDCVCAWGWEAADAPFEVIADWCPFTEMIKRSRGHNSYYFNRRTSGAVFLCTKYSLCSLYTQEISTERGVNQNSTILTCALAN